MSLGIQAAEKPEDVRSVDAIHQEKEAERLVIGNRVAVYRKGEYRSARRSRDESTRSPWPLDFSGRRGPASALTLDGSNGRIPNTATMRPATSSSTATCWSSLGPLSRISSSRWRLPVRGVW